MTSFVGLLGGVTLLGEIPRILGASSMVTDDLMCDSGRFQSYKTSRFPSRKFVALIGRNIPSPGLLGFFLGGNRRNLRTN